MHAYFIFPVFFPFFVFVFVFVYSVVIVVGQSSFSTKRTHFSSVLQYLNMEDSGQPLGDYFK